MGKWRNGIGDNNIFVKGGEGGGVWGWRKSSSSPKSFLLLFKIIFFLRLLRLPPCCCPPPFLFIFPNVRASTKKKPEAIFLEEEGDSNKCQLIKISKSQNIH
jgi:hypothetical protein